VFPSASECAERIECAFQSFLFLARPLAIEEFLASGKERCLRFNNLLQDHAFVRFQNGGPIESPPILMAGA